MSGSADSGRSAELYVRSLRPRAAYTSQRAVVERLADLAADGSLAEYAVRVTGKAIPPSPSAACTEFGTYLVNRVAVFEEWADRSDRPLAPIHRCSVRSGFTGEEYDALVLPEMVLADYRADSLQFVAPSGEGDSHVTVHERLDALGAGEVEAVEAESLERARIAPVEEFSGSPG